MLILYSGVASSAAAIQNLLDQVAPPSRRPDRTGRAHRIPATRQRSECRTRPPPSPRPPCPNTSTLIPRFSPPLMPLTTRSGARAELGQRQLHAIGRAAFDGPTAPPLAVEHFLGHQRAQERDRVPHAALLDRRRDDAHIAQPPQRTLHRRQTRRIDAVVVGKQNLHAATFVHQAATVRRAVTSIIP